MPANNAADRPCIIVAGLGRCGTSLTMQMLHAAGIECAGEWPGFEVDKMSPHRPDVAWLAAQRGRAVKVLDAHRMTFSAGLPNHIVIWLSRDHREQARSQLKFLSALMTGVRKDRGAVRVMERSLVKDEIAARARLGLYGGGPSLSLRFESLIERREETAATMSKWLEGFGYETDPAKMAAVVRARSTKCLPGLLEGDLIAARQLSSRA